MIRQHVVAAMAVIGVASCSSETRSYVVADDACVSYGLHVGTPQYRLCTEREAKIAGSGRTVAEAVPSAR
jgi:hypothetical protein